MAQISNPDAGGSTAVAQTSASQVMANTSTNALTAPDAAASLTGAQKSAVLLVALGVEAAGKILKGLHDEEVERISIEIARFRNVSADIVESVLIEYRDMKMAQNFIAQGGSDFAREVLKTALGDRRAEEIMMRVEAAMEVSAFHLLQTVETSQLTNFLMYEHPQTAALILAHLNARKAADILSGFKPEMQTDILMRLATMNKTSPELLRDIEEVIRGQIGSLFGTEMSVAGGVEKVAEILNNSSRTSERVLMEQIRNADDDLATQIKNFMFVFDDLITVSGRDLQRLLMEIEQRDLALALKASSEELKAKMLENLSERVGQTLLEELELMGPVRVSDVDEAQKRILAAAQKLEEEEEITLTRSKSDSMI